VAAFVLGGAAKSGTSTLADLLASHPDIHVIARKEAHHYLFRGQAPAFCGPGDETFARMVVSDPGHWAELLAEGQHLATVGEASVYYLYRREVWPILANALGPDGRVVLILRDPVERVASAWGHLVRDGREWLSLSDALAAEDERVALGWEWCWHLRRVSRYHEQLPAVLDAFDRDRVFVADFAELKTDPHGLLARIQGFLGVDLVDVDDSVPTINPSGSVRSSRVHGFLTQPHPVKDALRPFVPDRFIQQVYRRSLARNLRPLPPMSPEVRATLAQDFADVPSGVRALVGLDTSGWCAPRAEATLRQ